MIDYEFAGLTFFAFVLCLQGDMQDRCDDIIQGSTAETKVEE